MLLISLIGSHYRQITNLSGVCNVITFCTGKVNFVGEKDIGHIP